MVTTGHSNCEYADVQGACSVLIIKDSYTEVQRIVILCFYMCMKLDLSL